MFLIKKYTSAAIFILFLLFLLDFDVITCARGIGRGGSSGGSRLGGLARAGSSRLGGGGRFSSATRTWTQVAAGLFAYNMMSRMVHTRHYHGGGGYYYNNNNRQSNGYFCRNLESFNGTVFDRFQCPLGDFPSDYKYCCGPTDYQYCCKFFDDTGRTVGVVAAIFAFVGLIFCGVMCLVKMKRNSSPILFKNRSNEPNAQMIPPQQFGRPSFFGSPAYPPPRSSNPSPNPSNIYHQNLPRPYPAMPAPNTAAPYPNMPAPAPTGNMPYPPPATNGSSQLPYPNVQAMPAPSLNNNAEYPPPPVYADIVQNNIKEETQPFIPKPNF